MRWGTEPPNLQRRWVDPTALDNASIDLTRDDPRVYRTSSKRSKQQKSQGRGRQTIPRQKQNTTASRNPTGIIGDGREGRPGIDLALRRYSLHCAVSLGKT